MITVTTAAEILAALAKNADEQFEIGGSAEIELSISVGRPFFRVSGAAKLHVEAWGSSAPRVEARESSAPHVVAWESSAPHVVAWGSSAPRVEARESSAPHVVAWESSAPHVVARESSAPHVVAWESSAPRVVARESSAPHVVAWESSAPRVVARESSAPRVEAWGSSAPHVEAKGYAQLRLFGATIKAVLGANVAVLLHRGAKATGGKQTRVTIKTAADWCDYYGVTVERGVATLYKALNADFTSPYRTSYAPGSTPVAADWDGGKRECGLGLHFSPSPSMALEFHAAATKFAACRVRLADIAIHPDGQYPQKVKARGCCGPCYEVSRDGDPIGDVPPMPKLAKSTKPRKRVARGVA